MVATCSNGPPPDILTLLSPRTEPIDIPPPNNLAWQVLCNVTKNREGLEAALAASLVENLIGLLVEGRPAEVQREASLTLAISCFDDMAKIVAIQVWAPGRWCSRSISRLERECACFAVA